MKTNLNLLQQAVKSMSFKLLMTSIVFIALFTTSAQAQPFGPNCTTTQIDISTGIDNTGAILPYPAAGSTQDPYWTVTMVPTNTIGLVAPFCAEVLDNVSGAVGAAQPGAAYISFATTPTVANLGAGSGFFWTYHHGTIPPGPINQAGPTRFTRQFYIEGSSAQTVTINLDGYGDDIIFVAVDATPGVPIFNTPANPNNVYYAAATSTTLVPMSVSGYNINLSPGMHTIDVDLYDISGVITSISLSGNISINTPVLAQNVCYGENDCGSIEPDKCDDLCYWTVHGNNIQYNRNNFGTTSDDDVNIITNAWMRGIITTGAQDVGASFLGWNTMAPTSIFHVNCDGNHPDYSGQSDVRFENLEHGTGNILVIDDEGHVFRTDYFIEDIIRGADGTGKNSGNIYDLYEEEKAKRELLETQLLQIQTRLDAIEGCCSGKSGNTDGWQGTKSTLYQNTPNPFSSETSVSYDIRNMGFEAYIAVYDIKGMEVTRYNIAGQGKGSIIIKTERMVSGMYTYSLVVDGQMIDTKKMIFSKE